MHHIIPVLGLDIDMITIPVLVWAVYFAFVIGIVASYYNKIYLGRAVRSVIDAKAYGEENAKTAEELGFAKSPLILSAIEKGILSRFIKIKEEEGQRLYYMDEELRIRAELRYQGKKSELYFGIIGIIVFLILAFVAAEYLPELFDLLKDLAS